jgi:hypothetical protein
VAFSLPMWHKFSFFLRQNPWISGSTEGLRVKRTDMSWVFGFHLLKGEEGIPCLLTQSGRR